MTHTEWINGVGDKINRMTNWQRNQWARAGYKVHLIDYYLTLQRKVVDK